MALTKDQKKIIASEAQTELARRELAKRKMFYFTMYTFPGYQVNWHHIAICKKLDEFFEGKIKRLMLFVPPRHGKSELASRRLPAYIMGRDPGAEIIATSYSAGLASTNNRDVQRIIDSTEYANIFPETKLFSKNIRTVSRGSYLRNSDVFEIVGHRGVYRSAGIGGGITGRGFVYGIIDDPIKNRQEAESKTFRDNIWGWYTSTFYPRQEGSQARILVILTRWNSDDLAGRLLEQKRLGGDFADDWEIVNFPAIAVDPIHKDDPRVVGDALWPGKFPIKMLQTIKATVGGYNWSSLYQQKPHPAGGGKIKRGWFNIIDSPPEGLYWSRFWDLAVSTKTSADYTASVAGAVDEDGNIYLRDMIRGQWEWPDTHKILIQTSQAEDIPVGVEEAGQQRGFIDELFRDQELQSVSIEGVKADKDKLTRALPWIARAQVGKVFLIKGGWVNEFLNECQSFTGHGDKHDDQIDAVSGIYKMCCEYVEPEIW